MALLESVNDSRPGDLVDDKSRNYMARPYNAVERTKLLTASKGVLLTLRLVSARYGNEEGIIDFDLAPPPSDDAVEIIRQVQETTAGPTKIEWGLILDKLTATIKNIEQWDFPQFSFQDYQRDRIGTLAALQAEFLLAKLKANEALFRTERGEKIPTLRYIRETQGVEPERIGSESLREQYEKVAGLFENLRYGPYNGANMSTYRQEQHCTPEEVEHYVKFHARRFAEALNEFLGYNRLFKSGLEPNYSVAQVDKDDYWVAWAKGIRNLYSLLLNTNDERHGDRWTIGKTEQIALHEVAAHFCQMQGWQNSIDEGFLVPALGITHIHDPEQVSSEGLAQALHLFVPSIGKSVEGLTPAGLFETEAEALRQMVYNNVHIIINTQEASLKQIADYVHRFCPAETIAEIRKQMKDRKDHPTKRSYLYAYGYGFALHRWIASNLTVRGSKELLRFLTTQPTTPKQEMTFVMSMIQDGGEQYGVVKKTFRDYLDENVAA